MNEVKPTIGGVVNDIKILDELSCQICLQYFSNPMTCPCGHTFCRACIERALQRKLECPLDRQYVAPDQLRENYIVRNIVERVQFACKNAKLGCPWKGSAQQWEVHESMCGFIPAQC